MYCATNNYKSILIFTLLLAIVICSPQNAISQNNKVYNIAILSSGNIWSKDIFLNGLKDALVPYNLQNNIIFPEDMHIALSFFDGKNHEDDYEKAANELMQNDKVSLILAVGPEAVQALLEENNHITPVLSVLTPGVKNLGYINVNNGMSIAKNFTFAYSRDIWLNAFSLFRTSLPFKKMGVIYPPSKNGKAFSALYELQEVARDFGFELIKHKSASLNPSPEECQEDINKLIRQGIDAIYLSPLICFNFVNKDAQVEQLLYVLHKNDVRTFAGPAGMQVRVGALMGANGLTPDTYGEHIFTNIFKILQIPFKPLVVYEDAVNYFRSVDAKGHSKLRVSFNVKTARMINVEIPLRLLIVADGIFDKTLEPVKSINEL